LILYTDQHGKSAWLSALRTFHFFTARCGRIFDALSSMKHLDLNQNKFYYLIEMTDKIVINRQYPIRAEKRSCYEKL